MNALSPIVSKDMRTDSLIIAEKFGKRHDNIIKRIRATMDELPEDFSALNFEAAEYIDAQGKTRQMYEMTRDGFTLTVMGFTGAAALAWKIRFIEAFNAMEQELRLGAGQEAVGKSIAEKIAMVREARMTYGKDVAKGVWESVGLPAIVSKNIGLQGNAKVTLKQRIIDMLKGSDGEAPKDIAHRLRRTVSREDVETAVRGLLASGLVEVIEHKPARGPSSKRLRLA